MVGTCCGPWSVTWPGGITHERRANPARGSADAALIAACDAFHRAEAAVAHGDRAPIRTDGDWQSLVDAPGKAWWTALGKVSACPAPATPQGIQAKAAAALVALTRFAKGEEGERPEIVLALATLRDVAGEGWRMRPNPKAPASDAKLLAACIRFDAVNVRHDLLNVGSSISDDEAEEIIDAWVKLRNKIAAMPAHTLEGQQAKAKVAFITLRDKECMHSWQKKHWSQQVEPADRMALECLAVFAGLEGV